MWQPLIIDSNDADGVSALHASGTVLRDPLTVAHGQHAACARTGMR
jgi:hypothetical protein